MSWNVSRVKEVLFSSRNISIKNNWVTVAAARHIFALKKDYYNRALKIIHTLRNKRDWCALLRSPLNTFIITNFIFVHKNILASLLLTFYYTSLT
jgi:hypothetical protein